MSLTEREKEISRASYARRRAADPEGMAKKARDRDSRLLGHTVLPLSEYLRSLPKYLSRAEKYAAKPREIQSQSAGMAEGSPRIRKKLEGKQP
jgi:hypothetical protein